MLMLIALSLDFRIDIIFGVAVLEIESTQFLKNPKKKCMNFLIDLKYLKIILLSNTW